MMATQSKSFNLNACVNEIADLIKEIDTDLDKLAKTSSEDVWQENKWSENNWSDRFAYKHLCQLFEELRHDDFGNTDKLHAFISMASTLERSTDRLLNFNKWNKEYRDLLGLAYLFCNSVSELGQNMCA